MGHTKSYSCDERGCSARCVTPGTPSITTVPRCRMPCLRNGPGESQRRTGSVCSPFPLCSAQHRHEHTTPACSAEPPFSMAWAAPPHQCSVMGASTLLCTRMMRRSPTTHRSVGPGMRPLMAMRRRRNPSGAPTFQAAVRLYLRVRGLGPAAGRGMGRGAGATGEADGPCLRARAVGGEPGGGEVGRNGLRSPRVSVQLVAQNPKTVQH